MANCKGEPCLITKYTFKWDNAKISAANGHYKDGSSADITQKAQNNQQLVRDAIDGKAKAELDEETKNGRSIPKKIVKASASSYTFIDASCGPDGECLCDETDDSTTKPGKPIKKTFTISGLTPNPSTPFDKGTGGSITVCDRFSVTIVVWATPEVTTGVCLSLKDDAF
jgi:hypothetical protein